MVKNATLSLDDFGGAAVAVASADDDDDDDDDDNDDEDDDGVDDGCCVEADAAASPPVPARCRDAVASAMFASLAMRRRRPCVCNWYISSEGDMYRLKWCVMRFESETREL
jgi:hypothetical protein